MIVFNLLESVLRIILFVSGLFFVIPVLNSFQPTSSLLEIQLLEVLLSLLNACFLILHLTNLVVTSYTPFGKSVSTSDAFLTNFSGYNTRIAVAVLGLSLCYTRGIEASYTFPIQGQDSVLNLTAYTSGVGEFFIEVGNFEDDVGEKLRHNTFLAQNGLFYGSLLFALLYFVEKYLPQLGLYFNTEVDRSRWICTRWYETDPSLLGYVQRGPTLRTLTLGTLVFASLILEFLWAFEQFKSGTLTYTDNFSDFIVICTAAAVSTNCFYKTFTNYVNRVYYPLYISDIAIAVQVTSYSTISTFPRLVPDASRPVCAVVAAAPLCTVILVYLITFNVNLPKVVALSIRDVQHALVYNLAHDNVNKFFRLVWPIGVVGAVLGVFFAYYSFVGDAFDFEFTSGSSIASIKSIVQSVEDEFDQVIQNVNSFLTTITPCTTQDTYYQNSPNVVAFYNPVDGTTTTYTRPTYFEIQNQLIQLYPECFDEPSGGFYAWKQPPPAGVCTREYNQFMEMQSNTTAFFDYRSAATIPTEIENDDQFTDDEGQVPVDKSGTPFTVVKLDPQCINILCYSFTALMGGLFVSNLIPFVNIATVPATKLARVAYRISRFGHKMLKYARKMYAKRRKLTRFVKTIRSLSAIGNPILKFNIAIAFMFIPTIVLGLFALLLAFFKRDITARQKRSLLQQENVRMQLFIIFTVLAAFNLALFWGFFGFSVQGSRSLEIVQAYLDELSGDASIIKATVQYGVGMRYLRYSLITSCISALFFAAALGVEFVYSFFVRALTSRRVYSKLKTPPIEIAEEMPRTASRVSLNNNWASTLSTLVFVAPILYFAYISFNDTRVRWFDVTATQDQRTADMSESIASSEIIAESSEIVSEDTSTEERQCGIIALAIEPVYNVLLDELQDAFAPIYSTLSSLKSSAGNLVNALKVGNVFGSIDINIPYSAVEFWIVFTLPLLYCVVCAIDIVLTGIYTFNQRDTLLPIVNNVDYVLTSLAVTSLQVNLVLYAVFVSFAEVDVPLFNINVSMGKMLQHSIYSSLLCIACSVSLFFNRLLPLV